METQRDLGKYIQTIRKAEKITQEELSQRLGVSKMTVTQYETGRNNFTFTTLLKIASALGYKLKITLEKE